METLRKALPWLVSAVLAAALVAPAAIGQSDESPVGPSLDEIIALLDPAAIRNINADKVDGKHAVGATTNKQKRAGKLVATNREGFLPSNIVKPYWGSIKGKPAGFADNVDNTGVTGVTVEQVSYELDVPAGLSRSLFADCPAGSAVVGGGFHRNYSGNVEIIISAPQDADTWKVSARNPGSVTRKVIAYAVCMTVTE